MDAFANITIPVKVTADAAAGGAPAADAPARAFGGELPGSSPHDRADNLLYWGTAGEWVIQRPTVRYYGADFMRRLNAMQIPRHAFGGQIGESLVNRLQMPSLPSAGSSSGMSGGTPLLLDFGKLGRYTASTSNDVANELVQVFKRAALARGKR